jgi:hypothetical protein
MLAALHNLGNLYFLILTRGMKRKSRSATKANTYSDIYLFLRHNFIGAEVAGNDETVSFLGWFLAYNSL